MPSGYRNRDGIDFDALFKPRGVNTPGPVTGFKIGNPPGVDLNQFYRASTSALDRIDSPTGFVSTLLGKDLYEVFRDINYNSVITITQHPVGILALTTGSSGTLTVSATVEGGGTPLYQWRKNNLDINGATGTSYTISNAQMTDIGNYDCQVSFDGETVTSYFAELHIAPSFTLNPGGNYSYNIGQQVTFTIAAQGEGTIFYGWRKNGVYIPGAYYPSYQFTIASLADAGNYDCVISSTWGNAASNTFSLTVLQVTPPVITGGTVLSSHNLTSGAFFNYSVTATGSITEYQWFKNGVAIPNATGANYTFFSLTVGDSGTYLVRVTGPGGQDSATSTLNVTEPAPTYVSGTLSPTGMTHNLSVNNQAQFEVYFNGSNVLVYWFKNGALIGSQYFPGTNFGTRSIGASFAAQLSNNGDFYQAEIRNSGGYVLTSATLYVS